MHHFADSWLMSVLECLQERACAYEHRGNHNYLLRDTPTWEPIKLSLAEIVVSKARPVDSKTKRKSGFQSYIFLTITLSNICYGTMSVFSGLTLAFSALSSLCIALSAYQTQKTWLTWATLAHKLVCFPWNMLLINHSTSPTAPRPLLFSH